MSKIKVIEVVSGLGMGGAEKALQSRLSYQPQNFESVVFNLRPQIDALNLNVKFKIIYSKSLFIGFYWQFQKLLQSFDPEIVIVRTPFDAIRVSLFKTLFHCSEWKLVFEAHSVEVSQNLFVSKLLSPLLRIANSQTDLVIAVSRSVAHGPQCRGAKKLVVHHVGADAKIEHNSHKSLTFLFIARFVSLKQPLLLLEAIRLSADAFLGHGAKVKLIGKGPLENAMVEFIEANNLGEIVEMYGYRDDLDSIYSRSEYLLSTSKFEGLPITFFEAKMHGLRIITTPSSGDFDILGPEDSVLQDFKVETLVDTLKGALEDGILDDESRISIQHQNAWMQAETRAQIYYELIGSDLKKAR